MKKIALALLASLLLCGCAANGGFSKKDKEIINTSTEGILHVYTIESEDETMILRAKSEDLSRRALKSREYALLAKRMVETVSDTAVGGVGIAAPQIGINKRVVAVQRFDKEGAPFEVYPNIYILDYSEDKKKGPEGCLSVPNERYEVLRSTSVTIRYFDINEGKVVTESVEGFTAVIFQHEVDHLEGIIYTDRVLM